MGSRRRGGHGGADGVAPVGQRDSGEHFTGRYEARTIADAGHNLPQEFPAEFADAVLTLRGWSGGE